MTHLGIDDGYDTVPGDATTNRRSLPVIGVDVDVLIDDAFQEFTSFGESVVIDGGVED